MNDQRRAALRWLILFAFVWLIDYVIAEATGSVLYWISTVALETLWSFGVSTAWQMIVPYIMRLSLGCLRFLVIGFAYCWLIDIRWQRAGTVSAALFLALQWIPFFWSWGVAGAPGIGRFTMIRVAFGSGWFYMDSVVAFAAALAGARFFQAKRHNQRLSEVKDLLLSSRIFMIGE